MKKVALGNGQFTSYRPWSKERRLRARYHRLQLAHGSANEPIETLHNAHETSRRAERIVREADEMNQHVKAKWSDEQKLGASERTKAQWRKWRGRRRLKTTKQEKAEIAARIRSGANSRADRKAERARIAAEIKAAHAIRRAQRAEARQLKERLKGLKVLRRLIKDTAPIGRLIKLNGSIEELQRILDGESVETGKASKNV